METACTTPKHTGLTETGLKWIALGTMVLDHIHYFFGFTGVIPEWFSMVGRLGAPLFLFCLVEGFTHTHSRKRYFAKVYLISAAMSGLLFFMAYGGILVRPDGFYPTNGMMTTFVILMVIWQGLDWLGEEKLLRGLAAVILVGDHGRQQLAGAGHGAGALSLPQAPGDAGGGVLRLLHPLWCDIYGADGLPAAGLCLGSAVHPIL